MGKGLVAVAAAIAGLGLGGGAWAQDWASPPCQQVVGHAEIGGVTQMIYGVACLQPDGTWQLVDSGGGSVGYAAPDYYYDPWYWSPYIGFGGVVFIDHFHHHHFMHHVFFPNHGVIVRGGGFAHGGFRGGFHGSPPPGGFHGGAPGGFHGGAPPGGFHGGGGMHH